MSHFPSSERYFLLISAEGFSVSGLFNIFITQEAPSNQLMWHVVILRILSGSSCRPDHAK